MAGHCQLHCLFWPAMLHGTNYRTPTRVNVHGYLTINGEEPSPVAHSSPPVLTWNTWTLSICVITTPPNSPTVLMTLT